MTVTERLLHYVSFDTQSDESSETCPSTAKQKLLGEAVRAISRHDVDAMRRVLLALGQPKGPVDHAQINADIDALLSRYAETDLESVSMPQLLDDVLALAKRHGIALPPGMSMLARGLSTIEGVVVALDPHFNIMRATAAHISRGAFTPEAARKKLKSAAASVYDSLDINSSILPFSSRRRRVVVSSVSKRRLLAGISAWVMRFIKVDFPALV